LREVKAAVKVPIVAIGGITEENVDQVIAVGADAVAVISAVCLADDVEAAARRLASRVG
jgi:thiamine-phosphate pyrophosphorylase